jgi:hypothetical protein
VKTIERKMIAANRFNYLEELILVRTELKFTLRTILILAILSRIKLEQFDLIDRKQSDSSYE